MRAPPPPPSLLLLLLLLAAAACGRLAPGPVGLFIPERPRPPPLDDGPQPAEAPKIAVHAGFFQQRVDHDDPSRGTFTQRYWWNADHYAGPGAPVVLNAPGENSADGYQGYTTNRTLPGRFAQATGGAAVLLEHRFWGGSSPAARLTPDALRTLSLRNAIRDMVYFAQTVRLPFDPHGASRPARAPWVLSGCSYPGALAAWTAALAPGTFWAYHCSSAVVEAVSALWQYYEPIERAMPRNCSADFRAVVAHVDDALRAGHRGRRAEAARLKRRFGLAALDHDDDFAAALVSKLGDWQNTQFYTGYTPLHRMCDYIENAWPGSNASAPGPHGVGLRRALDGFAKWSREVMIPGTCAEFGYWKDNSSTACFDTHDARSPMFTDTSVNNTVNRQWMWFLCNEPFEWWQVWAPGASSGLVPRRLSRGYWRRQCALYFPPGPDGRPTYGLARGRSVAGVNARTGGWSPAAVANTTRLMWVNGELDPWRPATVSADSRPGGPLPSRPGAPVWVLPAAAHCNDLIVKNANANPEIKRIMDAEVEQMRVWVDEFYQLHGGRNSSYGYNGARG